MNLLESVVRSWLKRTKDGVDSRRVDAGNIMFAQKYRFVIWAYLSLVRYLFGAGVYCVQSRYSALLM